MTEETVNKRTARIILRLRRKFENGEDWEQYLRGQVWCSRVIKDFLELLDDFPETIRIKAQQFAQESKEYRAKKAELAAIACKQEEIRKEESARRELEEFRNASNPAKHLAGRITMAAALGASKEVVEQAKQLRQRGVLTEKCREILGCTLVELNRWDKDGRLPHAFTKRVRLDAKCVTARVWDSSEVELAKQNVSNWRKLDALRTRTKIPN